MRAIWAGLVLTMAVGAAAAPHPRPAPHRPPAPRWTGSWEAAQQLPEPVNIAPRGAGTLRQIVHLSLGGKTIRVRISNAFGAAPLHLREVRVATALGSASLSFAGAPDTVIPPGADYVSDPLAFAVAPRSDLTVTLRYDDPKWPLTGHPGSRATSYVAVDGAAETAVQHWYLLAGVEVSGLPARGAVVALGDSITDGRGSTTDANDRWPDDLARRLPGIGVLNAGIGGNRLLLDGNGPNALSRFDRDVLAPAGVRWLIVLEGINDLGVLTRDAPATPQDHAAAVAGLIAAYRQVVARAHAHGIKVLGGTLSPWIGFDYYHPDAANEADRQAVNAWIRGRGHFDAVVDFDARLRDPAAPDRLLAAFDSGDHIHPSPAGYQAMADAIPIGFFR